MLLFQFPKGAMLLNILPCTISFTSRVSSTLRLYALINALQEQGPTLSWGVKKSSRDWGGGEVPPLVLFIHIFLQPYMFCSPLLRSANSLGLTDLPHSRNKFLIPGKLKSHGKFFQTLSCTLCSLGFLLSYISALLIFSQMIL